MRCAEVMPTWSSESAGRDPRCSERDEGGGGREEEVRGSEDDDEVESCSSYLPVV